MTDLHKAAQQALEALHEIAWSNDSRWQTDRAESVIPALRAALTQQPQTPCDIAEDGVCEVIDCCRNSPQQDQEPALIVEKEPDYMSRGHFYEGSKPFIDPTLVWKLPIGTKLYTHPPRREWRGLCAEERYRIASESASTIVAVLATEAALKEKNNG